MKVFLDANILFSAAHPDWLTGPFLKKVAKSATIITSPYAEEEARRNLQSYDRSLLPALDAWLGHVEMVPEATLSAFPPSLPEKDHPILGAAIAAHSTYLLTGDSRHFGSFMGEKIQGVTIVSQRLLAEMLRKKGLLLIERESARRLAKLSGTSPKTPAIPRR